MSCLCECHYMHMEVRGQPQVVVLSLHLVRERASSSLQHAPAWLGLELRGFSCFPSGWRNARITNEWSLLCPGFCGCKFQSWCCAAGALPRSHLSWLLPMDANKSDSFLTFSQQSGCYPHSPGSWFVWLGACFQVPSLFQCVVTSFVVMDDAATCADQRVFLPPFSVYWAQRLHCVNLGS